jgi:MoaA/NifB/PqqE/SkfB family radical SAM enzyme
MNINGITKLTIELTSYCNAKCPQCPRHDDRGQYRTIIPLDHLNFDNFVKSIDTDKLKNLKIVQFEGDRGDPVMHPDLIKFVQFFSFVPDIQIVTNGSIQNTNWWKTLATYKNVTVTFSIDGLEDTNHFYRVGISFKKIIENATTYINNGGNANWKCIVFKHNQHQIEAIKQYANDLKFSKVFFVSADISRFMGQSTWPVYLNLKHEYDIAPSTLFSNQHIQINYQSSTPTSQYIFHQTLCPELQYGNIYIDFLGRVIPCCMMHYEPYEDEGSHLLTIIGGDWNSISLYHYSLENILSNEFYTHSLNKSFESEKTIHRHCKNICDIVPK